MASAATLIGITGDGAAPRNHSSPSAPSTGRPRSWWPSRPPAMERPCLQPGGREALPGFRRGCGFDRRIHRLPRVNDRQVFEVTTSGVVTELAHLAVSVEINVFDASPKTQARQLVTIDPFTGSAYWVGAPADRTGSHPWGPAGTRASPFPPGRRARHGSELLEIPVSRPLAGEPFRAFRGPL